jgi:hypothetical protein
MSDLDFLMSELSRMDRKGQRGGSTDPTFRNSIADLEEICFDSAPPPPSSSALFVQLCRAAQHGDDKRLAELLKDSRVGGVLDRSRTTGSFGTALYAAAVKRHTSIVAKLCAAGANPNEARSSDGATALMAATAARSEGCVSVLLALDTIDANATNHAGQSALVLAGLAVELYVTCTASSPPFYHCCCCCCCCCCC